MKATKLLYGAALAGGIVTGVNLSTINEAVAECSLVNFETLEPSFDANEMDGATVICSANYPNCDTDTAMAWYANGGNMIRVGLDQVDDDFERALISAEDGDLYHKNSIEAYEVLSRIAFRGAIASFNERDLVLPSGGSDLAMQVGENMFPDAMPAARECQTFTKIAIGHHLLQEHAGTPEYINDPFTGEYGPYYAGNDWIMEQAANYFYFGNNAYGVEAAAQAKLGKSASDLTIVEAAYLAGAINAPSDMDGIPDNDDPSDDEAEIQREMDLAQERTETVLLDMKEHDPNFADEVDAAYLAQPRVQDFIILQRFRQGEDEGTDRAEGLGAMHYLERIKESVKETLGLTDEEFRDNLVINTTLNENVQRAIIEGVNSVDWPRDGRQIAVVALAQDGRVLGMRGGDWSQSQVNLATRPGPVGSSLKIYYYAWALQNGLIVPRQEFIDVPLNFDVPDSNGNRYIVDEGAHCPNPASCSLADAIAFSDNVVPLTMVYNAQESGVGILQGTSDLMHAFNMYGESPIVLSNVLGSWETTAYSLATGMNSLINNRGRVQANTSIVSVFDNDDSQMVQIDQGKFAVAPGNQVIAPEYSDAIREGMWGTITRGTAANTLGAAALSAACKTGSAPEGMSAAITCVVDTDNGPVTFAIVMRHVEDLTNMGPGSNGGQIPARILLEIVSRL